MAKLSKFLFAYILITFLGCSAMAEQPIFYTTKTASLNGPTDGNLIQLLERFDTIVIKFGGGGLVYGMMDTLRYLKDRPEKTIVIDGGCYSACTLLLESPNVLLTTNARMHFHSATAYKCEGGKTVGIPGVKANFDMLKSFRMVTQHWIMRSQAYGSTAFTEMPVKMVRKIYKTKYVDFVWVRGTITEIKLIPGPAKSVC